MKKVKPNSIWFTSTIVFGAMTVNIAANAVVMKKQNTTYSIDGNNGARQGQQIYLYKTNTENVNQQWIEASVDGDYFYYQKQNTNLCLDGGEGAINRQAVTLETCDENNKNQHWLKISTPNDSFRLEKRGTNFSIDGNNGGTNKQLIYLWDSNDNNMNQQWSFLYQNASVPVVSFANPISNATLSVDELLSVAVNAEDPNGDIVSVSLAIDNDFIRIERHSPYEWGDRDAKLQNLSPGTYRLTATAEDNDGLTTQVSTTITIEDNTAPVATPTPAPVATPTPAPIATPTPAPVATPTPDPELVALYQSGAQIWAASNTNARSRAGCAISVWCSNLGSHMPVLSWSARCYPQTRAHSPANSKFSQYTGHA